VTTVDTVFTGSIASLYDRYLGPLLFETYAQDLANSGVRPQSRARAGDRRRHRNRHARAGPLAISQRQYCCYRSEPAHARPCRRTDFVKAV
jgi:hypothetical protein